MIRIITIIVFAIAAIVNQAFSQNLQVDLKGRVVNENNEPVASVSIYVMTESSNVIVKTGLSDEDGRYTVSAVPQGKYYISVSSVGFAGGKSAAFEFLGKPIEIPTIVLQPQSQAIQGVTVVGQLPLVQNVDGKLVLNVENSTLAAGNNALEILKRAPGVTVDHEDNILLMGRSGINVTIDGRQTFMTGEQLASFLKSTDGSQIKSVEVGTTRTAKDDAEGTAGTINIVLKKNRTEGFNGSFQASAGMGHHFRGNTSLNLNYKKNNTTIFGTYAYRDNKVQIDLDLMRIIRDTLTRSDKAFDQDALLIERDKSHNYRFGIEQRTSERNVMLLQFSAMNNGEDSRNNSIANIGPPAGAVDSLMEASSLSSNFFNRYSINFNNEFKTDTLGGKLTLDLDWSKFNTKNNVDYDYRTKWPNGQLIYDPEIERSAMPVNIDIYVGKLDFVKPFSKASKIETGVKYSNVRSDNDLQFEHLINNQWQEYEGRPNHFIYTEQITAAYLDYSTSFGKWSLKGGLRGEYTVSDGNSITMSNRVKRDYLDLFPSANVTRTLNENHILSLSYARKISRPNYRHLNPFRYFIDKYTAQIGNPYLAPQYTNGFSLNYTLKQKFNITLGSDITTDAMTESMGQAGDTTWITRENLGKHTMTYLNLNTPFSIGKRWNMNNNVTLAYMHFKGPISGSYIDDGSLFFQVNSINNIRINSRFGAEATLMYMPPFIYNLYRIGTRMSLDAGFNYNFKDQRSSLKLAVTDIFRTNKNNASTGFHIYDTSFRQYNDNRTVRLTYSFRFGNLKQNVRKNDTDNEERQRAL